MADALCAGWLLQGPDRVISAMTAYTQAMWTHDFNQLQKTLGDFSVDLVDKSIQELGREYIRQYGLVESFSVVSLSSIEEAYRDWNTLLPMVRPFYAMKCFADKNVIKFMGQLGMGFDCASEWEMKTVMGLGADPDDVVLSHPVKRARDIDYAEKVGIRYVAVDSTSELEKLSGKSFKILLRIRVDDPEARIHLGRKFGALSNEYAHILMTALRMGLDVCGISFHVGSGCQNPNVFGEALREARRAMDLATHLGMCIELLDIGGGFTRSNFPECARSIRAGLDEHFGDASVRVIAEPGRYFAEQCLTLFTCVQGVREREGKMEYWISEGLYGPFNCILYDGQRPVPFPLDPRQGPSSTSVLWGPTCDSADCVYDSVELPPLKFGDWLVFPGCGAYTVAGACDFNGLQSTKIPTFYIYSV